MQCPKCHSENLFYVEDRFSEGGFLMLGYYKCFICAYQIQTEDVKITEVKKERSDRRG